MATLPNYVWQTWVSGSTSTSATSYSYTDTVWSGWVADTYTSNNITYSTTSTTTGDYIWLKWVGDACEATPKKEPRSKIIYVSEPVNAPLKVTPEPKFDRLALRAQNAQKSIDDIWRDLLAEEKRKAEAEAESVAKELLLQLIGDDEFKRYEKAGRLFVRGKGKFDYLISKNGGVTRIEKNKVIDFIEKRTKVTGKNICIHLKNSYQFPPTDNVIALKLMIEAEEQRFLRVGNLGSHESDVLGLDEVIGQ